MSIELPSHDFSRVSEAADRYPCLQLLSGPPVSSTDKNSDGDSGPEWRIGAYVYPVEGEMLIGRTPEAALVLKDSSISRRHMSVHTEGARVSVRDLGSRNGISINGDRLAENASRELVHLDRVRLGVYEWLFLDHEPTPEDRLAHDSLSSSDDWSVLSSEEAQKVSEETGDHAHGPTPDDDIHDHDEVASSRELLQDAAQDEADNRLDHAPLVNINSASPDDQQTDSTDGETTPIGAFFSDETTPPKTRRGLIIVAVVLLIVASFVFLGWRYRDDLRATYSKVMSVVRPSSKPRTQTLNDRADLAVTADVNRDNGLSVVSMPVEKVTQKITSLFLSVNSSPIPARLMFDNREMGTTPIELNIDVEINKSYVLKSTYALSEWGETFTTEQAIRVEPGRDKLAIDLRAELGMLKLLELPRDVTVYLEGTFAYDPYRVRSVRLQEVVYGRPIFMPYGDYVLELRGVPPADNPHGNSSATEDIVFRRNFSLNAEHATEEVRILDRELGVFPVTITSDPPQAEIFYDGVKIGETPFEGTLQQGSHRIVLRKHGFQDFSQEIKVWRNEPEQFAFKLPTTDVGEKLYQAWSSFRVEAYPRVIDTLSEALSKTPTPDESLEIQYLLGETYRAMKECDKAKNYYAGAKASTIFREKALLGFAACAATLGEPSLAIVNLADVFMNSTDRDLLAQAEHLFHQVSPIRSVFYITTKPTGALLKVNGRLVSDVTPLLLTDLVLGNYTFELSKDGYEPVSRRETLKLSEFKPLLIELVPIPGAIPEQALPIAPTSSDTPTVVLPETPVN